MIKWPFILKRINIFFIQQNFVQKMKVLFWRLLFQSTTFPNFPSWRNLNHSGRKFVRKPNFQVCLDKNLHLSYTFPQAPNTSKAMTSDICQIWITVQMTIQTQKRPFTERCIVTLKCYNAMLGTLVSISSLNAFPINYSLQRTWSCRNFGLTW